MTIRLSIFIIFLLALPMEAAREDSDFKKCEKLYLEGKYAKALPCYINFLSRYPHSPHRPLVLFRQAELTGEYYQSIIIFRELLEQYPHSPQAEPARFQLARLYYLWGNNTEALAEFELFIRDFPRSEKYARVCYSIGTIELLKKNYTKALKFFRRAETKARGVEIKALSRLGMANTRYHQEKIPLARDLYIELIDKYPSTEAVGAAYYGLGVTYEITGKFDKAFSAYKYVQSHFPDAPFTPHARSKSRLIAVRYPMVNLVDFLPPELARATPREYSVQVGSFKEKKRADHLKRKLRKKDYPARIVVIEDLFKVRVGKLATRAEAEDLAEKLKAAGFETFIITIHRRGHGLQRRQGR